MVSGCLSQMGHDAGARAVVVRSDVMAEDKCGATHSQRFEAGIPAKAVAPVLNRASNDVVRLPAKLILKGWGSRSISAIIAPSHFRGSADRSHCVYRLVNDDLAVNKPLAMKPFHPKPFRP